MPSLRYRDAARVQRELARAGYMTFRSEAIVIEQESNQQLDERQQSAAQTTKEERT